MIKGRVINVKAGKYFVKTSDNTFECTAKGAIKIKSDGIYVGDFVEVDGGVIVSVLERKSKLLRPNVANADVAVIVIANVPQPDLYLTDKFISHCFLSGMPVIIAVNKIDDDPTVFDVIKANYCGAVDRIFAVSAKRKDGLDELVDYLSGKLAVFTGQSAVGKTSIVNALFGENRRTGELSAKTNRGKQTTTECEIVEKGDLTVVDTPGFSALDLDLIKADIPASYPEFDGFNCKFRDCSHIKEIGCAVKDAVKNGEINADRYNRYVEIYESAKEDKYAKRKKN